MIEPVANAVALCASCHDWFDSHKMISLIHEPKKRVFSAHEESFTFLVKECGYSWKDLSYLYTQSKVPMKKDRKLKTQMLREYKKSSKFDL